jgi:hypothetical protein
MALDPAEQLISSWVFAAEQEGDVATDVGLALDSSVVSMVPLLRRPGGFLLAIPADHLASTEQTRGWQDSAYAFGPSKEISVPVATRTGAASRTLATRVLLADAHSSMANLTVDAEDSEVIGFIDNRGRIGSPHIPSLLAAAKRWVDEVAGQGVERMEGFVTGDEGAADSLAGGPESFPFLDGFGAPPAAASFPAPSGSGPATLRANVAAAPVGLAGSAFPGVDWGAAALQPSSAMMGHRPGLRPDLFVEPGLGAARPLTGRFAGGEFGRPPAPGAGEGLLRGARPLLLRPPGAPYPPRAGGMTFELPRPAAAAAPTPSLLETLVAQNAILMQTLATQRMQGGDPTLDAASGGGFGAARGSAQLGSLRHQLDSTPEAVTQEIRSNLALALGSSPSAAQDALAYVRQCCGFAGRPDLSYPAVMMAQAWNALEMGDVAQAQARIGLGLAGIDQSSRDGRWEIGFLLSRSAEVPQEAASRRPLRTLLAPHSQMASASWVAAAQNYLREAALTEKAIREYGKGKGNGKKGKDDKGGEQ